MELALWLIVACGGLSIVYGVVTTQACLRPMPVRPACRRFRRRCARARRPISSGNTPTIAIVGVVILVAAYFTARRLCGDRLSHRRGAFRRGWASSACSSRCARTLGVRSGGHRLAGQGSGPRVQVGRRHRHAGGGPGALGVTLYFMILRGPRLRGHKPHGGRWLVALSFGRLADFHLRASGWRLFTNGGRRGRATWWARSRLAFRGRSAQSRHHRRHVGDNVGDCAGMAADLFELCMW